MTRPEWPGESMESEKSQIDPSGGLIRRLGQHLVEAKLRRRVMVAISDRRLQGAEKNNLWGSGQSTVPELVGKKHEKIHSVVPHQGG